MHKDEFLMRLQKGLSGLPQKDLEERLDFYSEMIDDRIEEGLSLEEAIVSVGSAEEIIAQVMAETALPTPSKERSLPKRRLKAWEIVLLVLGFPLWGSLCLAALAVILAVYLSLWSVLLSLWAVFGALAGCAVGGVAAAGVSLIYSRDIPTGLAMLGAGILCAGLSIVLFFGCKMATKGVLAATTKFGKWVKSRFKKEAIQ